METKIMILKKNNSDVFFKYIENRPIQNYYKTSEKNYLLRISRKMNLTVFNLFLGKWKNELENYNTIVMFDNGFEDKIAKYIKKKNPNIRIILWYWNIITDYSEKFLESKNVDEFWTYNKKDAETYKINYNTQFYTNNLRLPENQIENDICFLGNAKDRKEQIIQLKKMLDKENIKTDFRIIENKKDFIQYDQYLKMLSKTKCILDFNANTESPLTLRVLEAMFLKKKLITNNINVANYDFYNKNNIFIIGKDEITNIKKFVSKPYIDIDEKIINYYDFEQWLKRFENR